MMKKYGWIYFLISQKFHKNKRNVRGNALCFPVSDISPLNRTWPTFLHYTQLVRRFSSVQNLADISPLYRTCPTFLQCRELVRHFSSDRTCPTILQWKNRNRKGGKINIHQPFTNYFQHLNIYFWTHNNTDIRIHSRFGWLIWFFRWRSFWLSIKLFP